MKNGDSEMFTGEREVWKKITIDNGEFDRYSVSNAGRVRSDGTQLKPRILKPLKNSINGYLYVAPCSKTKKKPKTFSIHRLVAHEFLGERPKGMEVNHMDATNKHNNGIYNLEYATPLENMTHMLKAGRNGNYLSNEKAMEIFPMHHERKIPVAAIAREIGVSYDTVRCILKGMRRPYLKKRWEESIK